MNERAFIARIEAANAAIIVQVEGLRRKKGLEIDYVPLSNESLKKWELAAWKQERERQLRELGRRSGGRPSGRPNGGAKEIVPTRITLQIDRNECRFGAITENASIPERLIPLDPRLVKRANDELAAASLPAAQLEQGLPSRRVTSLQ